MIWTFTILGALVRNALTFGGKGQFLLLKVMTVRFLVYALLGEYIDDILVRFVMNTQCFELRWRSTIVTSEDDYNQISCVRVVTN